MLHDDPSRVAGQTPGRFCGNVCPVREDRLARSVRVRQHRGIDVDHDLVPLPGCSGIDPMMERRFGDESQRVRLLLRHGGRLGGNVAPGRSCGNVVAVLRVCTLIQRLAGRGQRLQERGADLRRQPSADDDHPVFVSIHMERTAPVAPSALPSFGDAVHPAPATDDALDVLGGPGASDREQALLGLWTCHARQRPDFRVRQLATGEGLSQ